MTPAAIDVVKGALKARVFYEGGLSDVPDHRIRIRAAELVLKLARIFESDGGALEGPPLPCRLPSRNLLWPSCKSLEPDQPG